MLRQPPRYAVRSRDSPVHSRTLRIVLVAVTALALAGLAFATSQALMGSALPATDGTFACSTLIIRSVTPNGRVFTTDLRVGNLTPGDEGWGKIRIKNEGTLDAWVWFSGYTIDWWGSSIFRDSNGLTQGPRLTLSHTPAVKLIPAGAIREYSLGFQYPLNVPNGHQGRTGAASLKFTGVQVDQNPGGGWTKAVSGGAALSFTSLSSQSAHGGLVKFAMPAGAATAQISNSGYTDTLLASLTGLTYQTYVRNSSGVAPVLELSVDTNGDRTPDDLLTYRPQENGTVKRDTWQTWNAGSSSAQWRASGAQGLTTLAAYKLAHPMARILPEGSTGGLRFVAGKEGAVWSNWQGYLDNVTVITTEGTDFYDFN